MLACPTLCVRGREVRTDFQEVLRGRGTPPVMATSQHTFIAAHCFPAVDQNKGPYCTSIVFLASFKNCTRLLNPFP